MTTTAPTTEASPLRERVQALALARRSLETRLATLQKAEQAFAEAHKADYAGLSELRQTINQLDHDVRTLACREFETTNDKAPCAGVSIRITTALLYSEVDALRWATDTGQCLKLDVKAFEKVAEPMRLGFVTATKVPTATIARDLDAVLGAAELATAPAPAQDGAA